MVQRISDSLDGYDQAAIKCAGMGGDCPQDGFGAREGKPRSIEARDPSSLANFNADHRRSSYPWPRKLESKRNPTP